MVQYGTYPAQEGACEHGSDTPYHIVITRFTEYYGTAWDALLNYATVLEREVAPGVPGGAPVEARGQQLDARSRGPRTRRPSRVRSGSQGKTRVLDHVVEREQAPQEHFIGSSPAVADVLGAERAVDPAPADPADFPAFQCLVGCQPSLRHGPDEPKSLPAIDP